MIRALRKAAEALDAQRVAELSGSTMQSLPGRGAGYTPATSPPGQPATTEEAVEKA